MLPRSATSMAASVSVVYMWQATAQPRTATSQAEINMHTVHMFWTFW